MPEKTLTEKQKEKLCDYVGSMLVEALDEEDSRSMLKKHVADYVKTNKLDVDASQLLKDLKWSVKVTLKE